MIEFINAQSGNEMWVAEDRKEEYLEAGHKLDNKTQGENKKTEPVAKKKK